MAKHRAAMSKTIMLRNLFPFAEDFVHPRAADRALSAQGRAAILHSDSFDVLHFTLLLAFDTVCFFFHDCFLLYIKTTHFLFRKQKLILVYHNPEGIYT
jgi:hypothetical protein